jgi:ORF6N domain
MAKDALVPAERIEKAIRVIRGQNVLLDNDLAELFGATTSRRNEQVKRNQDRFPTISCFG